MPDTATLTVLRPGLSTTVQDAGRIGYYHVGIPLSGAMDQYAFRAANLLVGNDEQAAVLEMSLQGPELQVSADTVVAVTGAVLRPKCDGVEQPLNASFVVPAGTRLSFDFLKAGARAYLAVGGGIDVPPVLGSRSTYALGAFGGHQGRKLVAGDVLALGAPGPRVRAGRQLAPAFACSLQREVRLRVLPGLYDHRITPASARQFYARKWTAAPEADRIGYRYRGGEPLQFVPREQPFGAGGHPSNIVDAGYPFGSIQVPGGIEPIVLHRDAVSGGGYMMIGTVISADMDLIAQMQPNHEAQFVPVDMATALAARAAYRQRLDRMRASLAG